MRPIMPPVSTPDNKFHDGNPLTGELGTIVSAEHLNNEQDAIRDSQSELIAILTAANLAPDSNAGQVLAALKVLFATNNNTLGALAKLVGEANKLPYFTGADTAMLTTLTAAGRDLISKADVSAILTYLGLGEGPFVSAKGGQYGADFTFKSVSTVPTDKNGVAIFSAPEGTAAGQIVSGAVFAWNNDYYRIGHARSATTASGGFVIELAGVRQFALSPAGEASAIGDIRAGRNIIATNGVFEVEPDGINYTRVYSAHNPPPNVVSGASWSSVTERAFYNGQGFPTPTDSLAVFNIRFVGGMTNDGFIHCRYLQVYINGNWVVVN